MMGVHLLLYMERVVGDRCTSVAVHGAGGR